MSETITKDTINAALKRAIAEQRNFYVWDDKTPGFGFWASKKGRGSFVQQFARLGRLHRLTIGRWGVLTLDEARKKATVMRGDVAGGGDPAGERRGHYVRLATGSWGELVEVYFKKKRKVRKATDEVKAIIARHTKDWRARPAGSLTATEVDMLVSAIAERSPSTAYGLYAAIRPIFKWASEPKRHNGTPLIPVNPMLGTSPPEPVEARDRVLSDDELAAIWAATAGKPGAYGLGGSIINPIVRLLMLTGCRRDEIAALEWREVDLSRGTITLPKARTKNGKQHVVYLNALALHELLQIEPHGGKYVFSTGETPPSGWSKMKRSLDERSGVTGWRLHDLRRTFSTGLQRLKVPYEAREKCLNHVTGGLAAVYARHDYADECADAWAAWGKHIESFVMR